MKSYLPSIVKWIKLVTLLYLTSSVTVHVEGKNFINGNLRENIETRNISNNMNVIRIFTEQHKTVTLECNLAKQFSIYSWWKDDSEVKEISTNSKIRNVRYMLQENGDLSIQNVRLEDSGVWQCQAEDNNGEKNFSNKLILIVSEPPKNVYLMIDNRILDPGNPFIPVKENTDLKISCVVDEGNPKPSISWDLKLSNIGSQELIQEPFEILNYTSTERYLTVGARSDIVLKKVVRAYHNATLTCCVAHTALQQPMNVSVLLNVQYSPSFAITREPGFGLPIKEGMAVSLKCDVDANPKAQPIWKKDETDPPVQQTEDGFLNFTEIQKQHIGWYKCIANHPLGKFSSIGYFLNIRYDPGSTQTPEQEITSADQKLEVAVGDSVHISCQAGSSGCWSRLLPGVSTLEPLGEASELNLDKVIYQEAGKYICIVPPENGASAISQLKKAMFIDLTVTGKPTVHPAYQNLTTVLDQPVTLTTNFCANPRFTNAFWIRSEKIYSPGDGDEQIVAYEITETEIPHCHQAVLFLTKVKRHHAGEYIFIVRSQRGLVEGVFNLSIAKSDTSKYVVDKNCTNTIVITTYVFVILVSVIHKLILA